MTDVGPSFILYACSLLKCMYTTKNKMTARNNICFPWDMGLVSTEDIQSKQNDGSGVQKSSNTENGCHVQLRASCMHGCLLNPSLQHMSAN